MGRRGGVGGLRGADDRQRRHCAEHQRQDHEQTGRDDHQADEPAALLRGRPPPLGSRTGPPTGAASACRTSLGRHGALPALTAGRCDHTAATTREPVRGTMIGSEDTERDQPCRGRYRPARRTLRSNRERGSDGVAARRVRRGGHRSFGGLPLPVLRERLTTASRIGKPLPISRFGRIPDSFPRVNRDGPASGGC